MDYELDDEAADHPPQDREFTLSPPVIFGLFFVLVVVCAACFGLGYSMGGHKASVPVAAETVAPVANPNTSTNKPSAGSPVGSVSLITPKPFAAAVPPSTGTNPAPIVRTPPPAARTATAAVAAPIITGDFVVQVAAVSLAHQTDAQNLVHALRNKGYSVNAFPEPDKLIHIQAGPFSSRSTADAMRARLAADGYQPLIKQQ